MLVFNSTRDLSESVGIAQESWTNRLENAAMYFVSSIPVQEYSMSIDLKYNEHEGWAAEQSDGLRKADATGPAFTWGPLAKPPAYGKMKSRKEDPEFQRKRDQLTGRKRLKPLYRDGDEPPKPGAIRKSSITAPSSSIESPVGPYLEPLVPTQSKDATVPAQIPTDTSASGQSMAIRNILNI
jgi:hypothetical protein